MSTILEALPDIATLLLALLGLSLFFPRAVRMLEKPRWKWLSRAVATALIVIGVGGCISNIVLRHNDKIAREALQGDIANLKDQVATVQKKLNENINASVVVWRLQATGGIPLPNQEIPIRITYKVNDNTAQNIRVYNEVFTVSGGFTQPQAHKSFDEFQARAIKHLDHAGQTLRVESTLDGFLSLNLTKREISDLEHRPLPERSTYFMAIARWDNPSGSHGELSVCRVMSPPLLSLVVGQTTWHDCFH